jgi:hypothetical protein
MEARELGFGTKRPLALPNLAEVSIQADRCCTSGLPRSTIVQLAATASRPPCGRGCANRTMKHLSYPKVN